MNHYEQLKSVLNDIFELNKADLDFGIYRIINQKRKQVNAFIEQQLPLDIKEALSNTQPASQVELEQELKQLKKSLEELDIVAEENPKYLAKLEQLKAAGNSDALEQDVFSHLANFFRRYYKDGDFISMRRYKKDVYAIPYEGEEVKLHWANHDQYYIKSSENFKNYSFKLPDGPKITFQLKEANTEQNNNKTQGDAERRFALYTEQPVENTEGELFINFVYEPFPKATKQDALLSEALQVLTETIPAEFRGVFMLQPTEKNKERTLLEKHLTDYVSRNSFDYFIHKDLGGFLRRELDFYIKNEVLYIDDINDREPAFFVAQLGKVKALKAVASKIIEFLAQIENFQKKLWLKKKFVLRTDYCITLDRIDAKFYPEIFDNKTQLEAWKSLYGVEIANAEQLVFEPFLVLDTQFFSEDFKDRLLYEFKDLDAETDGLLMNSENFQALGLLQEKYEDKLQSIYIDPPYNTDASSIIYKNDYKDSSWLSLMENRLQLSKSLLSDEGLIAIAIDDVEVSQLRMLLSKIFEKEIGIAVVRSNPQSRKAKGKFSPVHEYGLFYSKDRNGVPFSIGHDENKPVRYPKEDEIGKYAWMTFIRAGSNDLRSDRPKLFYPIVVTNENSIRIPDLIWDADRNEYMVNEEIKENEVLVYPVKNIDGVKVEKRWQRGHLRVKEELSEYRVRRDLDGSISIDFKTRMDEEALPVTWWDVKEYASANYGASELKNIFRESKFNFPKAKKLVIDSLLASGMGQKNVTTLDYFAGSGTTGHAVIKLNREDGGRRKYILVEMGQYFNTVTKPRIQKVIYTDNWKNGQPQDKGGISQMVKYQMLESYEDTLNNLQLQAPSEQGLLEFSPRAQEEYLLQYMLDIESREHLVNLSMFRKPFDYQLNVTENNELRPVKVDLVETFNYLIGLHVQQVQRVKGIKVVEGVTRTGVRTLVIWRDLDTTTQEEVAKLVRRFYDGTRTREFQQIFINGDHHLENLRVAGDQFKIKLIEETFFKKMFDETDL
ncbi:MAG: site-specific DNA-methyltransferase [Chitinophagales bacterium]|nr:site-specific DNA-methyltransferase [Chitinophagales bacterium]